MPPKGSIGNLIFKGAPKAKTSGAPLLKDSDNSPNPLRDSYENRELGDSDFHFSVPFQLGKSDDPTTESKPEKSAPEPAINIKPMDIATEGLSKPPKKKRSRKRAKRAKNAP